MPSRDKLAEFTAPCAKHISGDEKGEAQIFLDHLFQSFGHTGGLKEAVATLEMRVARPDTAPGVPRKYPDSKKLVTGDCIRPSVAG